MILISRSSVEFACGIVPRQLRDGWHSPLSRGLLFDKRQLPDGHKRGRRKAASMYNCVDERRRGRLEHTEAL